MAKDVLARIKRNNRIELWICLVVGIAAAIAGVALGIF
jgi:ABC-type dipeptide/oligopeptide/nickel transport system permease subunit